MFKDFLDSYKKLPETNKSMIFLLWIYSAGGIMSGLFIYIYVYSINQDIFNAFIYGIITFTANLIGFSLTGYLASFYTWNIKNFFYYSFLLYILSFIFIFFFNGLFGVYLFSLIYGIGAGLFRCGVHTQELVNIKDKVRDLYSSVISGGDTLIRIIIPFLVAGIFYLTSIFFEFSGYIILFFILPFVYSLSFIFIKKIGDYKPNKIKKIDIKNFFNLSKYKYGLLYICSVGVYQALTWVLFPVISILILKSEINVGIYEGIFSLISTIIIIYLSAIRKPENRLKIMGILSFLIFINLIIFSFSFSFIGYVFYTLIALILGPLFRISEHVFDLKIMDTIKVEGSDFYPAMILREILLWIGRFGIILTFIYLNLIGFSDLNLIKIGLFIIGIFTIIAWLFIYLHMKYEHKEN